MSEETDTTIWQRATSRLPVYWKLATVRCGIYAIIIGYNSFLAGVEGYDSLSQMSSLQIYKLCGNIGVSVLGVWLAFLDQTLTQIRKPTDNPKT
jgi:hypothetical protein